MPSQHALRLCKSSSLPRRPFTTEAIMKRESSPVQLPALVLDCSAVRGALRGGLLVTALLFGGFHLPW